MKKCILIVIVMLLAACGAADEEESQPAENTTGSGVPLEEPLEEPANPSVPEEELETILENLEMTAEVEAESGQVVFQIVLANNGTEEVEVGFPSGQQYEIVVTNPDGEEVYRYSEGMFFTEAFVYKTISPEEELKWAETWTVGEEVDKEQSYTAEITLLPTRINKTTIEKGLFTLEKSFHFPEPEA